MSIVAVPYYRVSTSDKDQDPERQRETVEPWAEREHVVLLDAVIDEGTSASTKNPLERERFIEACERAKALGAAGVVVECSDRFSRQGAKLDAWAEVEVERRYGLQVFRCDKPLSLHGSMVGAVSDSVHAEGARAWVQAHASKVKSGMARKKKEGAKFGRPAKPLTKAEIKLVLDLRAEDPRNGWGRCARALTERRKAHLIVDPELRRRVEVSASHVRRAVLATLPEVLPCQKDSKAQ